MNLFNISKSVVYVSSTLGLLTISNLVFINPAGAFGITFSNGGFESDLTDWSSTGDVNVNTSIDGVNPVSGDNQAMINTGYSNINNRIDDLNSAGSYLNFNQTGTDPIDADTLVTNNSPNANSDLQSFLNLNTSAFSIPRQDSDGNTLSGFRLPKEGSAIYQDIVVTISAQDVLDGKNGFNLDFNWSYLSNDGTSPDFGNQDFSFISIANDPNPPGSVNQNDPNFNVGQIRLLGDSDQSIRDGNGNINDYPDGINDFIHSDTSFYDTNNVYTESVTGLAAGTYSYRVGFGVVDVDGYDRTSALLVDNLSVEQVPFDFSPSSGLLAVAGIFGLKTLLKRNDNEAKE